MSDEAERVVLQDGEPLPDIEVEAPEEKEEVQTEPKTYQERQEAKAMAGGWKPEEEWDGDPDLWVSAEAFNIRGEFIGKLKNKDAEIDSRIANLNKAHEAQLQVKLADLKAERDALIEEGGKAKEVNRIDEQMNTLRQPQAQPVPDAIQAWNEQNPWIMEPGAKSLFAKSLYAEAVQQGKSPEGIVNHVNQGIAREFPSQTVKKPSVSESEKGNGPKGFGKQATKALTMADVTAEEQKWREALPNAWKTDKEFLQAVTDSRKSK